MTNSNLECHIKSNTIWSIIDPYNLEVQNNPCKKNRSKSLKSLVKLDMYTVVTREANMRVQVAREGKRLEVMSMVSSQERDKK